MQGVKGFQTGHPGYNKPKPKVPLVCKECGKGFEVYPSRLKREVSFCSVECKRKSAILKEKISKGQGGKTIIACAQCKIDFRTYPYRIKQNKENFCSSKCYGLFYALPLEVLKEHKRQYRLDNLDEIKEKDKKYRENNLEKIQKVQRSYYLREKPQILEKQKRYAKEVYLPRYHADEKFNLKEVSKVAKRAAETRKRDPIHAREMDNKRRLHEDKVNEETKELATNYREPWYPSQVSFLKNNYKTMTYTELAFKMGRSMRAIRSAIDRYKLGRKTRQLKGVTYLVPKGTLI